MQAGRIYKLEVDRKTDIGYILKKDEEEVFLHFNDCDGKELEENEVVEAFIYIDKKAREAASLLLPIVDIDNYEWVEVVEVFKDGVFANIGIRKDVFISKDDLETDRNLWPQIGDKLFIKLKIEKNGKMFGQLAGKLEFIDMSKEVEVDYKESEATGTVFKIVEAGVNVFTEEGYLGFVHKSQFRKWPRLGEKVTGRIVFINDLGELNISLIPQKEHAISEDAKMILEYLERSNVMHLCDKSDSEDIKELLGISKSAFKRAVGSLLKADKITQDISKNEIHLKK